MSPYDKRENCKPSLQRKLKETVSLKNKMSLMDHTVIKRCAEREIDRALRLGNGEMSSQKVEKRLEDKNDFAE
jgi:superfamily II helicase